MTDVPDVLRRIVERRQARLAEYRATHSGTGGRSASLRHIPPGGDAFLRALRSAPGHAVIAEIKMGSPRLGSLHGSIDPVKQAETYAANGAACISVVVEPDFFFGSYELVRICRAASRLPVLAKDFVVDEIQLDWARSSGADAVLLIVALLTSEELEDLAAGARRRGLVPLVECHSAADLAKLRGQEWELVGINSRDLRTFEVDLRHVADLRPQMPAGALKVAESGIKSGREVGELAAAGFDAFLVGESLLLAEDVGGHLRDLVGAGASG